MSQTENSLSRRTLIGAGAVATGFALAPPPARSAGAGPAGQVVIRTDLAVVTLVSVFKVEPDTMAKLLDVLREGTESLFSKMPGFVASSVLIARDGHHAINYSQWRSAADIDGFRRDPRFAPYLQRLRSLATPETFDCAVAYVDAA